DRKNLIKNDIMKKLILEMYQSLKTVKFYSAFFLRKLLTKKDQEIFWSIF
ncbi:lactoylglutathione lyase and related lyases, partial ['Chrysanthemum coronarium' phytoplasma]